MDFGLRLRHWTGVAAGFVKLVNTSYPHCQGFVPIARHLGKHYKLDLLVGKKYKIDSILRFRIGIHTRT